ncbi:MAG: L-threonylcarbamoyladenylate synthase [Promethearchaeota archaeon]
MRVLDTSPASIGLAAEAIRSGGLVAFPTETVYGLGANAFDPVACAGIFEAKQRPKFDPLIVHVASVEQAEELAGPLNPQARKLAGAFWPGPLTLVLPKTPAVPGIVTAGLPTVAVRFPSHPVARELISRAGVPIAAPSANKFGGLSPTTARHVVEELGERVEFVLDGGRCPVGVESTIVKVGDPPVLLRPGGLPLEDLERCIGRVAVSTGPTPVPEAPGQLSRHYSPRTPLELARRCAGRCAGPKVPPGVRVGYLAFRDPPSDVEAEVVEVLSPGGDLREAAANLFAALHRLDAAGVDLIVAERVPDEGLGRAIMNRLTRAARAG